MIWVFFDKVFFSRFGVPYVVTQCRKQGFLENRLVFFASLCGGFLHSIPCVVWLVKSRF